MQVGSLFLYVSPQFSATQDPPPKKKKKKIYISKTLVILLQLAKLQISDKNSKRCRKTL